MNMHASRVSVAAGFGLFFIASIYHSKKISSLVFLTLAIMFHNSAICLCLIFLTRLSYQKLLILLILAIFVGVIINPLSFIVNFFDVIGLTNFSWMITSYTASEDYGYPMRLYDPRIALSLITALLIYNIRESLNNDFENYILKVYFIGVLLMVTFSSVTIIAWRVSYFYLISCVLVIPIICKYYNNRFFNSTQRAGIMSITYSLVYILYTLPIIFGAQVYDFYF